MDGANVVRFGKRWYHKHEEMMQWCTANVGLGGWLVYNNSENQRWMIECAYGNTKFIFNSAEDATAFTLRFGHYDNS